MWQAGKIVSTLRLIFSGISYVLISNSAKVGFAIHSAGFDKMSVSEILGLIKSTFTLHKNLRSCVFSRHLRDGK